MMLLQRELALMEIFRAQAVADKRDLKFYLDSERTLDEKIIRKEREEKERIELEQIEMATREQIASFNQRLDRYDTAVVEALMENEHALDIARTRREEIEEHAYRLPDGRMAFKSDDGRRVVDQNGRDVPPTTVHPDFIPNDLPREGAYRAAREEERRLERERDQLHKFQEKLDETRDKVNKGGVSVKELDALGDDLEKSMPPAVRQKVGGEAPGVRPDGLQSAPPVAPTAEMPAMGSESRRSRPDPFAPSFR